MIQEKDFLYRVPVKNVLVTTPRQQVRNPEILVDVEGGEFMHGNILDANSTNKLINQSVKDAVDNKLIESGYVTKDLLEAETTRATEQENSLKTLIGAETSARIKGDEDLSSKIKAEQTRAEGKEKEISDKLAIVNGDSNTEGSFRKAIADVVAAAPEDLDTLKEIADKLAGNDDLHTALNQAITEKADASALLNEVSRATGAESGLQAAIATKADATALSNYVLTTALNKQVDALNAAISAKQDAGNYIPYDNYNGHAYTLNGELMLGEEYSILALSNTGITLGGPGGSGFGLSSDAIGINNGETIVNISPVQISSTKNEVNQFKITPNSIILGNEEIPIVSISRKGIKFIAKTDKDIPTGNGSFINIDNYALKSELPVVPTKTSQLTNDSNFITAAELPDISIDMLSYGVEWDTTVADPTCTRIGNPLFHKSLPIQSEYKGCVVKNGELQYYLNPNDWSKMSNGEPSHLDGTDGDVMIRTPRFYGKSGSNGNKRWVRISTIQIDASWTEIPEMFISAYHNTIYTDNDVTKVASVVNKDVKYRGGGRRDSYDQYLDTDAFKSDLNKPVSNIARATMRTYAAAAGQELLCYEFYKWIFYWNYVIEYANFNSQKEFVSELTSDGYHQGGLGSGLTTWDWSQWGAHNGNYAITPCGYTNEFGNFSGVKAISIQSPEKTLYANRWRGFENPFGDIWTNLDGIVIKRAQAGDASAVYATSNASEFGDDTPLKNIIAQEVAKDGWIQEFSLGETAEIVPSSVGGSESTYKCDYHWCNTSFTDRRTLMVGGDAHTGGIAGLGYFASDSGVGSAGTNVGFRTVVRS